MTDSASTAESTANGTPDTPAGDPAERPEAPGTGTLYRERLYLPWWNWVLPLIAAGLLAAEVHMGYPGVRAWLPYVITIPVTGLLLWRFGAARIEVRDGELWAGEAHLPLRFAGEVQIVPKAAKRKVLGPSFDPAAYALHRSWVGPMLLIELTDPEDSTPYWLISTRHPERLVEAMKAASPAS